LIAQNHLVVRTMLRLNETNRHTGDCGWRQALDSQALSCVRGGFHGVPRLVAILLALLVWVASAVGQTLTDQADEIAFNRDIRPILSEHCFACHGPDQNQRQGDLRLDIRDGILTAASSGTVPVVVGHPETSELMARIRTDNPDLQMPPPKFEKKLNDAQKKTLEEWIASGASYEGHWAFSTPKRPKVPQSTKSDSIPSSSVTNPIDQFIQEKLERQGLNLAPEADRTTLIRRVTLDLTGIPPTPSELKSFLNDSSPRAYENLVDRLLASPHYGERMALTWMDYARYADSNGFQSDGSRDIWAWRDWTIAAYNKNLPFDQFTIEQLAGDMLPNATQDQIIATGFNRNHRLNGEGGRIEAEWFVETVIDRLETTGMTWLGLTLNCCRCHDHKYDPISQKEFYSLFAYLNSNDETGVLAPTGKNGENTPPLLTLTTPESKKELARLESEVAVAQTHYDDALVALPARMKAWESTFSSQAPEAVEWDPLTIESAVSQGGAKLSKLEDGSLLASGTNPANDTYVVAGKLAATEITAILLEVFPDPSLPNESLGRAPNGNFVLSDIAVHIESASLQVPLEIRFSKAEADYEQKGWPAQSVLGNQGKKNKKANDGWAIDGNDVSKRIPRKLLLIAEKATSLPQDSTIRITMKHATLANHNVGRFRISACSATGSEVSIDRIATARDVQKILSIESSQRNEIQNKTLREHYSKYVDVPVRDTILKLESAKKSLQNYRDELPTTMVMRERAPRDAFILHRGEYDKPGDKVTRGLPAVFANSTSTSPKDRLELARWIVDRNNPLTARVWVNREWERFFGIGLVKTSENFGTQAEYPSHPELLDWLACEFMESTIDGQRGADTATAWNMKSLQKRIVMSRTYRQSSRVDPALLKRDPENRLVARAPRLRLSGEALRDAALSVSGLLVNKIGGPSVRPYMPAGVWDETSKYGNLRNYQSDKGDGLYRRTMYTIWKRTAAPPSMLLFDAPNRETCSVKRSRTNTPLQALSLLNEITYIEAARHLAARVMLEGGTTHQDRIQYAFEIALARKPTSREFELLSQGLEDDTARFLAKPEAALQLLKLGDSPVRVELDTATHAAYTLLANVLLNLDEFITRE
jgi:hypothetical protein